jgi:C4-dicarboxylate transporter DctM subunit
MFCLTVFVWTARRPDLAPPGPKFSWREKLQAAKGGWEIFLLFLLVVGGIWGGFFTPTEAAAVGAFAAFLITLLKRRLTKQNLFSALIDTVKATGMIFAIVIGAILFNFFMGVSKLPQGLSSFISTLPVSPLVVLLFVILIFLILGCLMDTIAMALLAIPVVYPTIKNLGFDPVWFGVICTIMSEVGQVTPPVGISVFVVAGMTKDIPMYTVFRGIAPFLLAFAACVALLIAFPQIALFLPGIMKGQ